MKRVLTIYFLVFITSLLSGQTTDSVVSYVPYDLWIAADTGNLVVVKSCLDQGIYVDISDENNITALMLAAQSGHLEVVEYLAINEANVNAKPNFPGTPPLTAAVRNNFLDVSEYLIRHNANINLKDDYERQAIHYTSKYGLYEATDMLLYYETDVDETDSFGRTAIYYAIINSQFETAELLKEHGANMQRIDSNGNTYLHIIPEIDSIKIINFLLESDINLQAKNNEGLTALDIAVYQGNHYLASKLIEQGVKPQDSITEYYNTRTLANKSGNKDTRKLIKSQQIKSIHKPYFQFIDLGWDMQFNANDFLMGFHTGVYDNRYGIKFMIGGLFRTGPKKVNLYEGNSTYIQLDETRWGVYVGARKYFRFFPANENTFKLFAGINQIYSKPKYEAIANRQSASMITSPELGLSINLRRIISIEFSYKYCNYNISNISPHRAGISLVFGFNFRSEKESERNKYIIKE